MTAADPGLPPGVLGGDPAGNEPELVLVRKDEWESLRWWKEARAEEISLDLAHLTSENERLRRLVQEHHNVSHWLGGSEAQRKVGLAQWGVMCAVCAAHSGEQVVREAASESDRTNGGDHA